jgi:hypothetical protein
LDPKERVVVGQLTTLWDEDGNDVDAYPPRDLDADEIRRILRTGRPVPFVTQEFRFESGGSRLKWIRDDDRFGFWKNELQPHLADPQAARWSLEDFPDEYFYLATEWQRKRPRL